jgi:hypothetical protein
MISLRPSLITAHHSVSSLSDPAREASPCSRYFRPARDVDTTCTVRRNVHESLATKARAHRAPNLLRGCVGRSHVDHTDARNDFVGCFRRCDRHTLRAGFNAYNRQCVVIPLEVGPSGKDSQFRVGRWSQLGLGGGVGRKEPRVRRQCSARRSVLGVSGKARDVV